MGFDCKHAQPYAHRCVAQRGIKLATNACGVPTGATGPHHRSSTMSLAPCSASAFSCGIAGRRQSEATATAWMRPPDNNVLPLASVAKWPATRPPARSVQGRTRTAVRHQVELGAKALLQQLARKGAERAVAAARQHDRAGDRICFIRFPAAPGLRECSWRLRRYSSLATDSSISRADAVHPPSSRSGSAPINRTYGMSRCNGLWRQRRPPTLRASG